ncbi:flagellar biosynthesis protein FlgA [Rhodococcus spelaei]|uniref:Flagellar biosynthesis protein FlgA n=1 Tax=Rhodococcus spelaei TaxID=2546320 RepID=A0A541BNZ7_9NOCA|nr:SAF domain-containing protein [Rhodococcus spelaei]TQF74043.1 flagellar biosynthesis protein FlgA [Rhodococcus spelaei]
MPRRRDTLARTLGDRLARLTRPGWARTTLARRIGAAALALAALVLLIRGDRDADEVSVVTAARDLTPGEVLTLADLKVTPTGAGAVPAGALRVPEEAVGHTVAGPARRGEALTDVRLLGPRLAEAAVGGPDARVVPIRLADPEVTDVLRVGDRVDVLTVGADRSTEPRIVASGATVVLVTAKESGRTTRERVVMLALPSAAATTVAAASLSGALAVTFR